MASISGKVGAVFQNYSGTDKSKLIADFQDDEAWSSDLGTQTDDSTNYRLGTESIRVTEDDNSGGQLRTTLNSISLNLNQFESGAASDSSDYIYAIFYVSDAAKVNNSVRIAFDSDPTYDGNNVYLYEITSVVTGWNYVKIKKSAFSSSGSPDWSSIQSIRVDWTSTASALGAYVTYQALYLVDDEYDLALSNSTAYTMEQIGLYYNWECDIESDIEEITDFASTGWKTFLPTLNGFTVTAEKYWANGDYLSNIASDFILVLHTNETTGQRYDGLAKVTTDSVNTGVSTIVEESIGFQGSGELYYVDVQIIDS